MKTKFTPGPWWVDKEDFDGLPHMHTIMDGGCVIAHVESWDEESPEVQEQAKANAKAIAAVPALIAALQDCVAFFDANQNVPYAHKWRRKARAALKRAGVELDG